jgi:hypothetical protein
MKVRGAALLLSGALLAAGTGGVDAAPTLVR